MFRSLIILFVLTMSLPASAQYERTDSTRVDTFDNGQIKRIVQVKTKNLKKYQLLDFYGDKKLIIRLYDSTGTLRHKRETWHKKASYGKACREMHHKQKSYWDNGNIRSSYVSKCDCHKTIFKKYNREGKLLKKEKTIIRRLE